MPELTFFALTSHPVTPSGPLRFGQIWFSVNPTMSPPKASSTNPLRPLPLLPPTILGVSPLVRKVGRGTGKVGVGAAGKAITPTAKRVGSSSVLFTRPVSSPLSRDPKPSSTRTTAAQRIASSTTSVSRNGTGEQPGQKPRKPALGSRDLGSKAVLKRSTILVNTDRMVRKASIPASGRFMRKSKALPGPTSTSSPAQQPVLPRSPASGLRGRRLTDAHETPPPLGIKATQQDPEESSLKLQDELVGIGRQVGALTRRIDLCKSEDKENVDQVDAMFWKEEHAATHSDELSR